MSWQVARLSPARRPDFYQVHGDANEAGWCHCVAWWVPTWAGWGQRTAAENLALRQALFDQGHFDGYLLYLDARPAGWLQCGPRDRLEKLVRQFALPPDPAVWAVTCFLLAPAARGRGLAHHLLAAALDDLRAQGVARVQAFPRRGAGLDSGEVWTGPEALFQRAGFTLERDDRHRPIYGLRLA